jgi:hypothetical protein
VFGQLLVCGGWYDVSVRVATFSLYRTADSMKATSSARCSYATATVTPTATATATATATVTRVFAESLTINLVIGKHLECDAISCTATTGTPGEGTLATSLNLAFDSSGVIATGTIPSAIGEMTALKKIVLGGHKLTGSLPPEISGLTALSVLNLYSNSLSKSIPSQFGALTALQYFVGSASVTFICFLCPLRTQVSPSICNGTLQNLRDNRISGSMSPEMGKMTAMTRLLLYNNFRMTGSIPRELSGLTAMKELNLRNILLTGTLPPEISVLTAMTQLWLLGNHFSGSIPPEMSELTALKKL